MDIYVAKFQEHCFNISIQRYRLLTFYHFSGNTPTAITFCCRDNSLFQSPPTWFFSDFYLEKAQTRPAIFYIWLLDHADEAPYRQIWTPKVAKKHQFNIGKVWVYVCSHSNKTVRGCALQRVLPADHQAPRCLFFAFHQGNVGTRVLWLLV